VSYFSKFSKSRRELTTASCIWRVIVTSCQPLCLSSKTKDFRLYLFLMFRRDLQAFSLSAWLLDPLRQTEREVSDRRPMAGSKPSTRLFIIHWPAMHHLVSIIPFLTTALLPSPPFCRWGNWGYAGRLPLNQAWDSQAHFHLFSTFLTRGHFSHSLPGMFYPWDAGGQACPSTEGSMWTKFQLTPFSQPPYRVGVPSPPTYRWQHW
jgi:hypothetical protein